MGWRLQSLIDATKGIMTGELLGEDAVRFDSVSTDTRTLKSGALYIAIKGANFDGHDFIEQAVQQGAVAVLISEPVPSVVPAVLVDDTRIALGKFAAWHRKQMPLKSLVGITGSNGKTTVKTLLAHVLSSVAPTLATAGNLNNDFGVPRTLLQIDKDHDFAVIEMGANHQQEIRYLTHLACPDICLINNASDAHIEGFGSRQGVIQGKGEIIEGLVEGGTVLLNRDDAGFDYWFDKALHQGVNVVTFGEHKNADFRLLRYEANFFDSEFELMHQGNTYRFQFPLLGKHNALNATAVLSIARLLEIDWQMLKQSIQSFAGVAGRLQKQTLPNGVLLDDSYNANPESVKAGIDTLTAIEGQACLCLGAMAELGDTSDEAHVSVAEYAKQKGVKVLFVYGEATRPMLEAFGVGAKWFDSHHAMAKTLVELIRNQQVQNVLIKGSRSAQMEQVTAETLHSI